MLAVSLNIALIAVALAMLLNLWRLLRGPDVPDRVLALDTLYINTIALMILLGMRFGTSVFFEAALIIALLGFIGTVAFGKYLLRGNIIE
ncbi:K+/H+ antiporter subunit F [Alkalilimnicola sp. S0819]|uniref:K+/H+ antiporter subunit F n=1 Tax=Alkalilimnicola sp. S0819 TaxID=2613922 RepID=UPI001262005D|nr:K+/H+ antiporter subunit F [Alkalilimnicola sp. S0819]KAB7623162.1 K+/H+ antiporter subunit F [Alkalilimnicola sp. S0819]MPQ17006.1 K+/H+ antiporter subunit F [Alkalilimnicola sp. S0819]